ncbi:MAG: acylphosphatase [Pseudomonadota bacterium]
MTDRVSARIVLTGDVAHAAFPGWIARHAQKLGLTDVTARLIPNGLEIRAHGVAEMVQALALGASLGPETVLVETVEVTTEGNVHPSERP